MNVTHYAFTLPHPRHGRDQAEEAYVSLNGEVCWTKKESWKNQDGSQECGKDFTNPNNPYYEKRFKVTGCSVMLKGTGNQPLTIKVWTSLDQDAQDESFGIDNVLITPYKGPTTTPPCTCMPYFWRSRAWHPINKRTGNSMSQLQYARICNVPTSIRIFYLGCF